MVSSLDFSTSFKLDASFDPATGITRQKTPTSDLVKPNRRILATREWSRKKRIGRGAFGTVWLECDEKDRVRAIKEVAKESTGTPLKVDHKRELQALGRLSMYRNNFVHFHGWFEDDINVYLAMEYFELGDLESYITPNLVEDDARCITRQILRGLEILHALHFVHRDLKPQNIFVVKAAPRWWVKIGDFGISKRLRSDQEATWTMIGTSEYIAPEISIPYVLSRRDEDSDDEGDPRPTVAVDIWSLGCVLFRLFARQPPFSTQKKLRAYCRGKTHFPIEVLTEEHISEEGINILLGMMKPRPETRLTAAEAVKHPWVNIQKKGNPISTAPASKNSEEPSSEPSQLTTGREPTTDMGQNPIDQDLSSSSSSTEIPKWHSSAYELPNHVLRRGASNGWRIIPGIPSNPIKN